MMYTIPKVVDPSRAEPSSKAGQSAGAGEELKAWDFVRFGLWSTVVAVAVVVMAALLIAERGHHHADFIPSAVRVSALRVAAAFSIAIWGGLALVAIPALVEQRMQRIWAHRLSKRRARPSGTWDDWIDGPRLG